MFRADAGGWFADECCFLMKRLYLAAAVKVYGKVMWLFVLSVSEEN